MQFRQQLLIGVDSDLVHYPEYGRPDASPAPVVTVYGAGDDVLTAIDATLTGATATIGSFSQAVAVDASVGDRSVTFSATTGAVRGDKLWFTNQLGLSEEHVIVGASTTVVQLADTLAHAYTAGASSTAKSHRLSVTVGAAFNTAIVRKGRAVWTYYVDARRHDDVTYYDVVLQRSDWPVTVSDLREAFPAFPESAGPEQFDWMRLVDGARRVLETDLEGSEWYSDLLRNPQLAKQFIIAKTIERYFSNQAGDRFSGQLAYWTAQTAAAWEAIATYYLNDERDDDELEVAFA